MFGDEDFDLQDFDTYDTAHNGGDPSLCQELRPGGFWYEGRNTYSLGKDVGREHSDKGNH